MRSATSRRPGTASSSAATRTARTTSDTTPRRSRRSSSCATSSIRSAADGSRASPGAGRSVGAALLTAEDCTARSLPGARARRSAVLGQPPAQVRALVAQLALQALDLRAAAGDQRELALDMAEGLVEDLAAALRAGAGVVPLVAQRGAGLLRLEQVAQLLEADAEQLLEAQGLAQALDVVLAVEAMAAGLALAAGAKEAELLVVADRARRGADLARERADAQSF